MARTLGTLPFGTSKMLSLLNIYHPSLISQRFVTGKQREAMEEAGMDFVYMSVYEMILRKPIEFGEEV